MNNIIEWHQAKELPEQNREQQELAIAEFLEEDNEMASGADLQYWSEKTGKDLDWIIENGHNIRSEIKEVYYVENSLDAVWDF